MNIHSARTRARAALTVVCVCIGAVLANAQTRTESSPGLERLEGDWVRIDSSGSGDFGGLTSKFTPASLTPRGAAAMTEGARAAAAARGPAFAENARHNRGQPYIVVSRPCGAGPFGGGVLGTNPDSGAIHF